MKFDVKNVRNLGSSGNTEFMICCIFITFMAGYTLYLILVDKNELNEDDDLLENRMDK